MAGKYLSYNEHYWSLDIEGDLIPSTVVYCVTAVNIHTKEEFRSHDTLAIRAFVESVLGAGGRLVAHNGLGYDAPTLNRILGTRIRVSDVIDTLVLSMLYSPSLEGGHSLEAWGRRLRFPKTEWGDFSKWSQEMEDYCLNDSRLCRLVYLELIRRMTRVGFSEMSIELEHQAWSLLKQQQKNGFKLDIARAHGLLAELRSVQEQLREEIHEHWPPELKLIRSYSRALKKDGSPSANLVRHRLEYERVEVRGSVNEYDCYGYVAFNIGSPDQRTDRLLELGWKPREFTEAGHPQATRKGNLSPSLQEFVDESGDVRPGLIAKWIEVNARGNMIENWINEYNHDTGCIHGSLWLAGTLRYRHSGPNTANIPGVRKSKDDQVLLGSAGSWTYEARDLWVSRDPASRRMVGVDAKGIQLRILAEKIRNASFTEAILSADPHAANQAAFGLPSRSLAKTITYAILMGAGDNRIATEARIPLSEAKAAKALFFDKVPELRGLIAKLKAQLKSTGRIELCDGSWVIVPSDHMVIPYLLQGDESKIMKRAMTQIASTCRKEKIDALQVGMIHDELQFDVLEQHVSRFIEIVLACFSEAGKFFNYSVPIEGSASVGKSWAETH